MVSEEFTTRELVELVTTAQAKLFDTKVDSLDRSTREGFTQLATRMDRDAEERLRRDAEDRAWRKGIEDKVQRLERLADKITGGWGVVIVLSALAGLVSTLITVVKAFA